MFRARKLNWFAVLLCLLLAAVTWAVYWPVRHYEFVNYDDPDYVVENSHGTPGLTHAGIVWAFARLTGEKTYWHPLTWLSHMLDCQLYGLKAGPPHLVNLVFPIANTLLLLDYWPLRRFKRSWFKHQGSTSKPQVSTLRLRWEKLPFLVRAGKPDRAAAQYREAVRLGPKYPKDLNNLAWLLATQPDPRLRNGEEAHQLARRAADLTEGN